MSGRHIQNLELAAILKELEDDSTKGQIELKLIVDEIGKRLNRRQASVLYLILMEITSQTEISKLLGYSTPTICLEIKKIREVVAKLYFEEFGIDVYKRWPKQINKEL